MKKREFDVINTDLKSIDELIKCEKVEMNFLGGIKLDIKEAQFSVSQTVGGNNYGNMNVANGSINAINIVNSEQKEELINLIKFLKLSIMEQDVSKDEKESVLDDLDTIEEQIESESPKAIKLRKCIDGVKGFISKLPNALATGTLIMTKAEELYSKIKPLIEN